MIIKKFLPTLCVTGVFLLIFAVIVAPTFVQISYANSHTGGTSPNPTGGTNPIPTGGTSPNPTGGTNPIPNSNDNCQTGTFPNPLRSCTFTGLITDFANNVVLPLGSVIAVIFIIYSGFLFVTAGDSEDKIKKAKDTFKWAVVGTAVLLGAWVIANGIEATISQIRV
ncbi:MAG: hypothetical protein HQ402_03495 [Parcubacteria group bacterium]|nr:hypothetical protein [Parcubacteria group bacterium]